MTHKLSSQLFFVKPAFLLQPHLQYEGEFCVTLILFVQEMNQPHATSLSQQEQAVIMDSYAEYKKIYILAKSKSATARKTVYYAVIKFLIMQSLNFST